MILYDSDGNKFLAKKCKKPHLRQHRVRTLYEHTKTIDGEEVTFHFDTIWGRRYYFCWFNEWHYLPHFEDKGNKDAFDTKDFFTRIFTRRQ